MGRKRGENPQKRPKPEKSPKTGQLCLRQNHRVKRVSGAISFLDT
jgi:hypothetical protein